jgi:hypothetical protein
MWKLAPRSHVEEGQCGNKVDLKLTPVRKSLKKRQSVPAL